MSDVHIYYNIYCILRLESNSVVQITHTTMHQLVDFPFSFVIPKRLPFSLVTWRLSASLRDFKRRCSGLLIYLSGVCERFQRETYPNDVHLN